MAIEFAPGADHYVTLGIEDSATAEDIKSAFRARMRDLHPDHGGDSARATAVNLARDVLGDPSTRREYDKSRRAWFMALLKGPGLSRIFDADGRLTAHFAAQQRAQEAEDAAADAQQRATAPVSTFPSQSEQATRHARKWQWGVMADLAWPEVRNALRAGEWLPAITSLGAALLADRAIEMYCPAEQLAALDALIGPRQRERKAKLMKTLAQALGTQLGRDVEELAAQPGRAARSAAPPKARTSASRPAARNGSSGAGSR